MTKALAIAPSFALSPTAGSLDSYVHSVFQIPMLTAEEERTCAERFQSLGDLEAARRLVLAHLRFVVKIARGYQGYGLSQSDLIQEGSIGLMKAVKRFDPSVGVRLVSFAVHWIKAEIHEFIIKNWRIVKIATTKAQRKLFFNLRKMKKRLGWFSQKEIEEVAEDLGVKPKEVVQMEARMAAYDAGFDQPVNEDAPSSFSAADYLKAPESDPALLLEHSRAQTQQLSGLYAGLQALDARSQTIVQRRWLEEPRATLQDLADEYGVSVERIRQIEQAAFKKLKRQCSE